MKERLVEIMAEVDELFGDGVAKNNPNLVLKYFECEIKSKELSLHAEALLNINSDDEEGCLCDECSCKIDKDILEN